MDFTSASALLKNFETTKLWQMMQTLNLNELIHHPWFLGGVGALAFVALLLRWRLLLVLIIAITGFTYLYAYVQERGASLDSLGNETLLIFAGGGVFIIFLAIYLLFVQGD